jgi:hypothetical protein
MTEVRVWGDCSESELLGILTQLWEKDRGKHSSDLRIVAPGCLIPFGTYPRIVDRLRQFCQADQMTHGRRTAIVASDEFQKALLELYRIESQSLPFEVGVFMSRDEAVRWLREDQQPAQA